MVGNSRFFDSLRPVKQEVGLRAFYTSSVATRPDPKYLTMRERLRHHIQALSVGTGISSERELASQYGVSRMTARRAIEDLTREGLLERHVGRGTFVAQPRIELRLSLSSFTQEEMIFCSSPSRKFSSAKYP